jgi:hypothetical protein
MSSRSFPSGSSWGPGPQERWSPILGRSTFSGNEGSGVDVRRTDEAVRLFAELDPDKTAAALHLTC